MSSRPLYHLSFSVLVISNGILLIQSNVCAFQTVDVYGCFCVLFVWWIALNVALR
uniref:Uncharacterized protein n=1 Tax=Rhizophora mucronata TaxID=61149 RepID=A0A2P2QGL4_RHIMU